MIRINEQSKHYFKIDEKVNLQNKQNAKKYSVDNKLNFSQRNYAKMTLDNLRSELLQLEEQKKALLSNNKNNSDEANQIQLEIDLKSQQIHQIENYTESTSIRTQNIKYAAKTIRLGWVYKINKLWEKMLLTGILGAIMSVITWLLVQYTGVYSPGISGIIQGLSKIVRIQISDTGNVDLANLIYNIMFWGLYVVINIPLIAIAYYKIGKGFALLTLVYIITSQLVGFGLGFINNGNGVFIFTNMASPELNNINGYISGVQMLPWNSNEGLVFGLFVYALTQSIASGIIYSVIYIIGSSTGGTDIIGFYYSKIKNKSIANLITIFNVSSLIIGITLGSFTCWIIQYQKLNDTLSVQLGLQAFFSPNFVASVIGAVVSGILYNYYYPRNKVVKVQIYSEKINDIAIALKLSEWKYKLSISTSDMSILQNDNLSSVRMLETICFYIDINSIVSIMHSIDTKGLITIYSTFGFDGELPTSSYER